MLPIRVVAIPTKTVEAVRETMASPYASHPAHAEIARGHGPCRHCLRVFDVGREQRLLFTFDPFAAVGGSPLPGPVFVHADMCERYPEDGGLPEGLESRELTLFAYFRPRELHSQTTCGAGMLEQVIQELFAKSEEVDYVHVHDTEAGCYDFRVERLVSC